MTNNTEKTRILPLSEVERGMVLAESIYTGTRMMVIPAGRTVNDEIMQILDFFSHQHQIGGCVSIINENCADRRKSA